MRNTNNKIHASQDKNNAFVSIGDEVCITLKNGKKVQGTITCIDIKKEDDKLHPFIDLAEGDCYIDGFWVENIQDLKIIRFKGEKEHD